MPAAARLSLIGVALLAALLCGCGGGGSGSGDDATIASRPPAAVVETSGPPQDGTRAPAPQDEERARSTAGGACQDRLGSFVASMDSLRRRLAVGVTYDQYLAEVRGIGSTYRRIPSRRVEIDCLNAVGAPGERAYNRYIDAANDWGECVSETGCSSAAVEPVLQRRWRIASRLLSEAEEGLDASAPRPPHASAP